MSTVQEQSPVPASRNILLAAMSVATLTILAGCGTTTKSAAAYAATNKSTAGAALVEVHNASVRGKSEKVLANRNGFTLYYFTKDTRTVSHCTGACSLLWHPLLASSAKLIQPKGLPDRLTVVSDTHGRQIAYNGHLLYLYWADRKPGQAAGEGVLKEWWVATPSLGSGSSAGGKSSGGGGGASGW